MDVICTPVCNYNGGQDCLIPFTAFREITQSAEGETEKITNYFEMILMVVLNKTMRMEVFLTTKISDYFDEWK